MSSSPFLSVSELDGLGGGSPAGEQPPIRAASSRSGQYASHLGCGTPTPDSGAGRARSCTPSCGPPIRRRPSHRIPPGTRQVEGDVLCMSQIASKMGSWSRGNTSANTSLQESSYEQVAGFFDDRGFLGRETPSHWAVIACYTPENQRHVHNHIIDSKAGVPLRQQTINAKRTIERDQQRREREMKMMTRTIGNTFSVCDAQHQRYLELLFEPMQNASDLIPHDLTMELESEMGATNAANDSRRRQTLRSLATLVKLGSLSFRSTGVTKQDPREGHAAALSLSSVQRQRLINIFQLYITRVDEAPGVDTMRRSTWFRFLYHCGAFDNEKGVSLTFSQCGSVFAMFSEDSLGGMHKTPTLSFGNWVNAIQHLLDGPKFNFKTQLALLDYLFCMWIRRCESRWANATRSLSPTQPHSRRKGRRPKQKEQAVVAERNFEWRVEVAEEQMCEPEVLQVLHEFEVPLRGLFAHYASRSGQASPTHKPESVPVAASPDPPSMDGLYPPGSVYDEDICDVPLDESDGHVGFVAANGALRLPIHGHQGHGRPDRLGADFVTSTNACENTPRSVVAARCVLSAFAEGGVDVADKDISLGTMSIASFEQMLVDFDLFPTVVQTHSAHQHAQISLRRHERNDFSYPAFIECLCRIAFVYLGAYGNSVQQSAPAKRKCLWLITFLRVGCQDLSLDVRPKGRRTSSLEDSWPRNMKFDLDHEPVRSLVLWKTLDTQIIKRTRPSSRSPPQPSPS